MTPASNIDLNPDNENDVLYVLKKGSNKNTINVDLMPQVVLRLDPKTSEVVGLIIHSFSKVFPSEFAGLHDWAKMEVFDLMIDMLNAEEKARPANA